MHPITSWGLWVCSSPLLLPCQLPPVPTRRWRSLKAQISSHAVSWSSKYEPEVLEDCDLPKVIAGVCSGCVGEWTVSGCKGLAHHRTPMWITQASPQTWVMCCIWCYKGYDVTRRQEFFRSIIIAWDHCDIPYVVRHWLKHGYVAHDHELLLLIDVYFYI